MKNPTQNYDDIVSVLACISTARQTVSSHRDIHGSVGSIISACITANQRQTLVRTYVQHRLNDGVSDWIACSEAGVNVRDRCIEHVVNST